MSISTHILDTSQGRPATDVGITLEVHHCGAWKELGRSKTDADGRARHLLPQGQALEVAVYRLRFETGDYYVAQQIAGLYPFVEVTFSVTDSTQHYHIPLLLTANGYTTYRGS